MVNRMTYDDFYTEDVLLQEEQERKKWHEENDRRIEVILSFADQVMETKEDKKIEQLLALLKGEELNDNLSNSGELLFLYIAAGIFCEEKSNQLFPTIFHVCSGVHDLISLLRQIKFYFWQYELKIGEEKEMLEFVTQRKISICVLYNVMVSANVKAISWLKELFGDNQQWIDYLENKEKQNSENGYDK